MIKLNTINDLAITFCKLQPNVENIEVLDLMLPETPMIIKLYVKPLYYLLYRNVMRKHFEAILKTEIPCGCCWKLQITYKNLKP